MGREAAFGWVMGALYVPVRDRCPGAAGRGGSGARGAVRGSAGAGDRPPAPQLCVARTPEAKEVSQTGRA
ncbi:hypothetical protein ACE1SV_33000 [Streptomyces sennicomposti]